MIKLVSWDVDGTLFSYRRLMSTLVRLAPRKIRKCGLKATLQQIAGTSRFHREVEAQRKGSDSRVIESQLERYAEAYANEREALDVALHLMQPPKQVVELLEAFETAGIPQVALSDFECRYKLQALGIERFFRNVYCCRDLGFWKPSPIPLAHIQTNYGIDPQEHLHIGDRADADGEACARNGCQSSNLNSLESARQLRLLLGINPIA